MHTNFENITSLLQERADIIRNFQKEIQALTLRNSILTDELLTFRLGKHHQENLTLKREIAHLKKLWFKDTNPKETEYALEFEEFNKYDN